jgi:hypothetical protein
MFDVIGSVDNFITVPSIVPDDAAPDGYRLERLALPIPAGFGVAAWVESGLPLPGTACHASCSRQLHTAHNLCSHAFHNSAWHRSVWFSAW